MLKYVWSCRLLRISEKLEWGRRWYVLLAYVLICDVLLDVDSLKQVCWTDTLNCQHGSFTYQWKRRLTESISNCGVWNDPALSMTSLLAVAFNV